MQGTRCTSQILLLQLSVVVVFIISTITIIFYCYGIHICRGLDVQQGSPGYYYYYTILCTIFFSIFFLFLVGYTITRVFVLTYFFFSLLCFFIVGYTITVRDSMCIAMLYMNTTRGE